MKTFLQIIKVSQDMRFVWAKNIAKYRISIIIVSESWDFVMESENIHEQGNKSLKWFYIQKFTDSCLTFRKAHCLQILFIAKVHCLQILLMSGWNGCWSKVCDVIIKLISEMDNGHPL